MRFAMCGINYSSDMQRRKFLTDSGSYVICMNVFGSINLDGNAFIADDSTTTDRFGPFYRPGAPIRADFNPTGFLGDLLQVSGTELKSNTTTPFKNCLIEIWQCDENFNLKGIQTLKYNDI